MMKFQFPWQKPAEDFDELEAALTRTLVSVSPRDEFVDSLYLRLMKAPSFPAVKRVPEPVGKTRQVVLVGLASVVGSAFVILAGARIIAAVLGALGILEANRQLKQSASPAHSTTSQ